MSSCHTKNVKILNHLHGPDFPPSTLLLKSTFLLDFPKGENDSDEWLTSWQLLLRSPVPENTCCGILECTNKMASRTQRRPIENSGKRTSKNSFLYSDWHITQGERHMPELTQWPQLHSVLLCTTSAPQCKHTLFCTSFSMAIKIVFGRGKNNQENPTPNKKRRLLIIKYAV